MQNGDIVQIGSGCSQTNDGKHQVEDHCRMCGQSAGLNEVAADAKRYRFIREHLAHHAKINTEVWFVNNGIFYLTGDTFNEAIDKEMERMGYE